MLKLGQLSPDGRSGVWEGVQVEGTSPTSRDCHDGVLVGDEFVIVGQNDGKYMNAPWRFHFHNRSWSQVPCIGEVSARRDFSILTQGNLLTLAGGIDFKGKPITTFASIGPLDARLDCIAGKPLGNADFIWIKVDPNLDIKNDGKVCVKNRENNGDYHTGIMGELSGGTYCWGLKVSQWRNSSIGVCSADVAWDCRPQDRSCKSLATIYTGGSGYVMQNGNQRSSYNFPNQGNGLVVGFVFDMDAGTLTVFYDGKQVGIMNGIDCSVPMHPFVSLDYIPEQVEIVEFEA
jgi:hypothetical protein